MADEIIAIVSFKRTISKKMTSIGKTDASIQIKGGGKDMVGKMLKRIIV